MAQLAVLELPDHAPLMESGEYGSSICPQRERARKSNAYPTYRHLDQEEAMFSTSNIWDSKQVGEELERMKLGPDGEAADNNNNGGGGGEDALGSAPASPDSSLARERSGTDYYECE